MTIHLLLYLFVALVVASFYLYSAHVQDGGRVTFLEVIFALIIGITWPLTLAVVIIYSVLDL